MIKQSQSGGDHATNIQSGGSVTIVQTGLSVQDVLDLVRSEFDRLSGEAVKVALARAEEMVTNRLFPKLVELNPGAVNAFADPDVQYALATALRTYARSGDSDVADVLVDILVERTKEPERTGLQLTLNESLDVVAKLNSEHFAALSLIWLIKYTHDPTVVDATSMSSYVSEILGPYVPMVRQNLAVFQHLEYAGCGSINMGHTDLEVIFRKNYPGLFAAGFTDDDVADTFKGSPPGRLHDLLVDGPRVGTYQFNFVTRQALEDAARGLGLGETEVELTSGLMNARLKSYPDVLQRLKDLCTDVMPSLSELWAGSSMKHMTLTTVGIAIAHANCRRVMGRSPAPLSIWIN